MNGTSRRNPRPSRSSAKKANTSAMAFPIRRGAYFHAASRSVLRTSMKKLPPLWASCVETLAIRNASCRSVASSMSKPCTLERTSAISTSHLRRSVMSRNTPDSATAVPRPGIVPGRAVAAPASAARLEKWRMTARLARFCASRSSVAEARAAVSACSAWATSSSVGAAAAHRAQQDAATFQLGL